ncbi:MAG: hypothetical protein ACC657_09160 [Thiohalomonadales bacterium]
MKYLLILAPLLFVFTTSNANATDYFYCDCQVGASNHCVAGKNTNRGTSKASPRKTFSNASSTFNRFNAGDSIQFCRGGSFTANAKYRWVNNKCTTAKNCTVTAYNLPGQKNHKLPRPIIIQKANKSLFALDDGGNADREEGYTFSDLDLRCSGCLKSGSGYGFFLFNDVDFVTIKNISIDNFRIGVYLAASNKTNRGSNGQLDNITLDNLKIVNSKRQGILGGANKLRLINSYFENNGSGTIYDHNIYISRGNRIVISGNDVYRSSLDTRGKCVGNPIVVHGTINNLLIENNTVRKDIGKAKSSCWGIAVDPGYKKSESFKNIVIKGNKILNVGNISIGVTSCNNCIIENNYISQEQPFKSTAISAPSRLRGSNDLALNKVIIRGNSIYTSASGTAIKLGTEGHRHVVVRNKIHYTGKGKFTCFNLGLRASSYSAVDYNTCYFPNALASSEWEAGSGSAPSPLIAWQGRSGFDANSKNVDPKIKNSTVPSPVNPVPPPVVEPVPPVVVDPPPPVVDPVPPVAVNPPPPAVDPVPPVSVVDSILVNWAIPTTRIDGTAIALSEIAGFKIYISTNSQSIPATPTVIITDGSVTSHNITNLTPGTYYIYVTTYDVNGDESPYSDPISKTI